MMHMNAGRNADKGFTLVELMITVVIIGILASIVMPSYQDYLRKGRRAAAQAVLMDVAQKQQQYLLDSRSFASDLSTLNVSTPDDVTKYYTITLEVGDATPPTFTATATPNSGTDQASDPTLAIDNTGKKTPADKW